MGYTNTAYLNESHYAERPEVLEWIEQCKKILPKSTPFITKSDGDQTLTTYLIYRPFNDQYTGVQTKTVEKLFGRKKVTVDLIKSIHFRYENQLSV